MLIVSDFNFKVVITAIHNSCNTYKTEALFCNPPTGEEIIELMRKNLSCSDETDGGIEKISIKVKQS